MPRKAKELGALAVRNLSAPGLHFVGEVPGLALQVLPTGAKTWVLRFSVNGRRRDMGLGGFPAVTLAGAKEKARKAREQLDDGVDPVEARRARRAASRAAAVKVMTFKEAGAAYIAAHEAAWKNPKHRQQWANTLKAYTEAKIGSLAVNDIELGHVLSVLEPIWTQKTETASRLRGRIELILDWAIARGYRPGPNPARWRGHLDKLLARPSKVARVRHHRALSLNQLGPFVRRLRLSTGSGPRALEFAILTAARSGEVRGATWSEVDLTEKIWTIPAERMKAGKEHRVPLSDPAVSLLQKVQLVRASEFIFSGVGGGALSDMALSAVTRRMKIAAVPHGFRSTFRDWAAERTSYPHEVCEMALAHTISNKAEAAYRRGDMFEKRRQMMSDWAEFCGSVEVPPDTVGQGAAE